MSQLSAPMAPVLGLRIMLVEDDALIAMLLGDMLENMGHCVVATAATEAAAIAAEEEFRPHLILADAGLRAGTGPNFVGAVLRKQFVPHIVMSGDIAAIDMAALGGGRGVSLSKPFFEDDLAWAIAQAMVPATVEIN
jgi:CheY-like chemotaxis protein